MPCIEFASVVKSYKPGLLQKQVLALDDVSFIVPSGTVFGLVGPNGAGKSTSIRLLLQLMRADGGCVRVDGCPVVVPAFLDRVGYLPENPYLYDHLTLSELLFFAGAANGLPRSHIRERIQVLAVRIGIEHALKRRLRTFSKGMRQRAALCFALLHDPDLIVLDEPMSGLDPLGRKMVCDLVLDLKQQGKTIFFCSHILSDVERLCDGLAILNKGRLVRTFSDAEMNAFRLGQMNLEEAFVASVDGGGGG